MTVTYLKSILLSILLLLLILVLRYDMTCSCLRPAANMYGVFPFLSAKSNSTPS